MGEPTKIRASLKDGEGELRFLLAHPMETGQRRDAAGALLPAHFIHTLTVAVNGRTVVDVSLAQGVAKNPLFSFRLTEVKAGDRVTVAWADNRGDTRSDEAVFT